MQHKIKDPRTAAEIEQLRNAMFTPEEWQKQSRGFRESLYPRTPQA